MADEKGHFKKSIFSNNTVMFSMKNTRSQFVGFSGSQVKLCPQLHK